MTFAIALVASQNSQQWPPGGCKEASISIAQCDQSIRIVRTHRPMQAARDIEPVRQLAFSAFARLIGCVELGHLFVFPSLQLDPTCGFTQ